MAAVLYTVFYAYCYLMGCFVVIFPQTGRHSVAEPEPEPQGATSFGRSRTVMRLRLRL
jgi:hypothetical protein